MAEETLKDYYRILQVDPQAEPEVIKAAFKRLALMYHPDQNRSPGANLRFMEIKEAFDVLGTPYRRQQYDRQRDSYAGMKGGGQYSTGQVGNKPERKKQGRTWFLFIFFILLIIIVTIAYIFSSQLLERIYLNPSGFQSAQTPDAVPGQGTILSATTPTVGRTPLLPSLGATYLQVYNAYIRMGDFEFDQAPLALPNQQVQISGMLTPGKYKSTVDVLTIGRPHGSQVDLCKAEVVIRINDQSESQIMLRYLKQLPQIITPSWAGNEWLSQGLIDAEKSSDRRSSQQINYYGILIGWVVDLKANTLTLSFNSACSTN